MDDDDNADDDNDDTHPPRIIVRIGMVFRRGQKLDNVITMLCKLGAKQGFWKKRKMTEIGKKKNGGGIQMSNPMMLSLMD